jgi:hypothetical protein
MVTATEAYNEKRVDPRYEGVYAEYEVFKDLEYGGPSNFRNAFIRNFSKTGISLYVTSPIGMDDFVRVRLYDPNSTVPIVVVCRTVWVKRTPYGLRSGQEHFDVGFRITRYEGASEGRLMQLINYFESLRHKGASIFDQIDAPHKLSA